jgi:3-oxoacyl-[acyl-carrier protein] reductase
MSHDLTDLVVLITGSGRGLGRGAALHLASCGAVIGVVDINGPSAKEVAAEIKTAGERAFAYEADLAGEKAFREVAKQFAADAGGRIDAVVNNASVLRYEPFEEVTEANVDLMIGAGLKSMIWGCQALIRHMDPERGGSIVNYASPVAVRGYARAAIYSSIKAAAAGLTRSLAAEFGPRGVRVNAVSPGPVSTDLWLGAGGVADTVAKATGTDAKQAREKIVAGLGGFATGRFSTPEDVATLVVLLASERTGNVTGSNYVIDGGLIKTT